MKWSPSGEFLGVSLNNAREILLYKITGRHRVQQWLTGHGVELACAAAHPRLERLTTSGYSELNNWDLSVPRPSPVAIGPNPGAVTSLAYSPDGARMAVASGQIVIRDAITGKEQSRFSRPAPWVYALAFDPAGGKLASGDLAGNVVLWDLATGRPVSQFTTGSQVNSIIFLDSPRRLLTYDRASVVVFDLESGDKQTFDLAGGRIRKLAADRERKSLVVGFESGALARFSLPDLTPVTRLEKAHTGSVACLAMSPDGRLLASASDHRVVLRDAQSLETLLQFPLWDGTLRDLTFACNGRRLAVVGTGNDVELWDLDALHEGLTDVGLDWDRPAAVDPVAEAAARGEHIPHAVPLIRRPGTTDPEVFAHARSLLVSGIAALKNGQRREAIRDLQQARNQFKALLQSNPSDGQVAGQLAISQLSLGDALRAEGRPAEALAASRRQGKSSKRCSSPPLGISTTSPVPMRFSACWTTREDRQRLPPIARRWRAKQWTPSSDSIAAGMKDFALLARDPDLDPLRERSDFRALILEATGRTREAIPHLAALSAANPKDTILSLKVAALQAWFGEEKEYNATRSRVLAFAMGTNDSLVADRAAKACTLRASIEKAELDQVLALSRTAVQSARNEWTLLGLGMAEYRAGNYAAADKSLLAAADAGPKNLQATSIATMYRAMILFRQGKADEAQSREHGRGKDEVPAQRREQPAGQCCRRQ